MRRLHISTFGCRANQYDSESVRALATAGGWQIVDAATDADVAVFNSCAVTAEAERALRRSVRRAARANSRLRSVVMGCASALPASAQALRALPGVSHLVAGADLATVALALEIPARDVARVARQQTVRAHLRIQDGCDEHCTFCATTMARGANRSRSAEELVLEARALSEWHPEIVLTGIHIGTWGMDVGSSLGVLVERLVREVPAVRFRLSSIEATELDTRLSELLASEPGRLAPHLHAPLQSGSDRLLRRMGRHWYTARTYAAAVERLLALRGVFGLGADVIVGFPGETEADFDATVQLIERLPFTYLHVFPFSARPGTAATRLPDPVSPAVMKDRSSRMRALGEAKAAAYRARRRGGAADAIVVTGAPRREGVTEDYLTVGVAEPRSRGERFAARLVLGTETLVAV